jgi:hypothetical protein
VLKKFPKKDNLLERIKKSFFSLLNKSGFFGQFKDIKYNDNRNSRLR